MKIFIDINHPAHVHYFKNFIKIMESKGHSFIITNRDDKITNQLLDIYRIKHYTRNKRNTKKSRFKGLLYLIKITMFCIKKSIQHKPDIYLGFGSSPCAITAFLFRKKSIILDDTEHNKLNHSIYIRFCTKVFTPFYFEKRLGPKQSYFNAYVEQLYLRSNYYKRNSQVLEDLGLEPYNYILVRYISYDAQHDKFIRHISDTKKQEIIQVLSQKYKVLVSCESSIVDEFYKPYLFSISPEKMHEIIAFSRFFITEGATMASEAAILGTPYLYMNPLKVGNINTQTKKYKYACQCSDEKEILSKMTLALEDSGSLSDRNSTVKRIETETIDPTQFLIEEIEKYQ